MGHEIDYVKMKIYKCISYLLLYLLYLRKKSTYRCVHEDAIFPTQQ